MTSDQKHEPGPIEKAYYTIRMALLSAREKNIEVSAANGDPMFLQAPIDEAIGKAYDQEKTAREQGK